MTTARELLAEQQSSGGVARATILWLAFWLVWIAAWAVGQLAYRRWLDIDFAYAIGLNFLVVITFVLAFFIWLRRFPRSGTRVDSRFSYLPIPLVLIAMLAGILLPTRHEMVFRQHAELFSAIALDDEGAASPLIAELPSPYSENVLFSDDQSVVFWGKDHAIAAVFIRSDQVEDQKICRPRCWYCVTRRIAAQWYICMYDWAI